MVDAASMSIGVSIHAPRAGGDAVQRIAVQPASRVSIHAPARGATRWTCQRRSRTRFNPRAPRGGRPRGRCHARPSAMFQSTRPRGARRADDCRRSFQSTPPRGGRPSAEPSSGRVSIHAPRAGGDTGSSSTARRAARCFNPRAPRGARPAARRRHAIADTCFNPRAPRGGRRWDSCRDDVGVEFQSTRPARGATTTLAQSPRSPDDVSIHAPRAGGDDRRSADPARSDVFQSTRPARGATQIGRSESALRVSIHAPARGATSNRGDIAARLVSIHAPRAGRDASSSAWFAPVACFNPRAPRGARRDVMADARDRSCFNPRAPRGARRAMRRIAVA